MICPVCSVEMKELTGSGVTIDHCEACKGTWFDNCEIKKFDESHEPLSLLTEITPPKQKLNTDGRKLSCPRCPTYKLIQHYYSYKRETRIDTCPACAGIWLDAGELVSIRNEFKTDAETRAEQKELVDRVVSSILQEMTEKQAEVLKTSNSVELRNRISAIISSIVR